MPTDVLVCNERKEGRKMETHFALCSISQSILPYFSVRVVGTSHQNEYTVLHCSKYTFVRLSPTRISTVTSPQSSERISIVITIHEIHISAHSAWANKSRNFCCCHCNCRYYCPSQKLRFSCLLLDEHTARSPRQTITLIKNDITMKTLSCRNGGESGENGI
jgi:hypothetical protein